MFVAKVLLLYSIHHPPLIHDSSPDQLSIHALPFTEGFDVPESLVCKFKTRICDFKNTFVSNKRCLEEFQKSCSVSSGRGEEVPGVADIFFPVQKVHRTTASETLNINKIEILITITRSL